MCQRRSSHQGTYQAFLSISQFQQGALKLTYCESLHTILWHPNALAGQLLFLDSYHLMDKLLPQGEMKLR